VRNLRPLGTALVLLLPALALAAPQQPAKPAAPATPVAPAAPAFDAKVVTIEAVRALVLPMKGSYTQHPAAFEKLFTFLATQGVQPKGAAFGRYFSDPSTPEADLLWEAGVPVGDGVKAQPPFEVKEIPAATVAVHVHRGAPEGLLTAWPEFVAWIVANGHRPLGPASQVFPSDWSVPQIEMRMPVEK
jgi:effector-binding domain-containing protein